MVGIMNKKGDGVSAPLEYTANIWLRMVELIAILLIVYFLGRYILKLIL